MLRYFIKIAQHTIIDVPGKLSTSLPSCLCGQHRHHLAHYLLPAGILCSSKTLTYTHNTHMVKVVLAGMLHFVRFCQIMFDAPNALVWLYTLCSEFLSFYIEQYCIFYEQARMKESKKKSLCASPPSVHLFLPISLFLFLCIWQGILSLRSSDLVSSE